MEQPPHLPDQRTYRGHDGLRQALLDWPSEWDDYRMEIRDISAVGPHVLVTVWQSGRGKASGVTVEDDYTFVHEVQDGKQVRWLMFATREEALEALGIEE